MNLNIKYILLVLALFFSTLNQAQNLKEESIYFLMTTRFFDGDPNNNRPTEWCSYYPNSGNNITDPNDVTWRGDFKGLVQKLDYIKDMGFTAIWITPIVQNRSPLDYHGYHAWDFTKVDPRLESPGYTFKTVIDSAHAKGLKIFLDVVLNHAGRYGIKGRAEIKYNTDPNQPWGKKSNGQTLTDNPNWTYDGLTANPDDGKIWSRANLAKMPAPYNSNLSAYNWPSMESYVNTSDALWYNKSGNGFAQGFDDTTNLYYRALAGDTPDLLTSGDSVRNYLFNAYKTFIDMGIDGMRLDAVKHMPKGDVLYFVDRFKQVNPNLMVFGEVAQKRHELHQIEQINPHWYTWRGNTGNSANSGIAILDFFAMGTFHLFGKGEGFSGVKAADRYDNLYSDPGSNVMFLDNHDFGPNNDWNRRYDGSPENLAAALNFMFTWRGLPCVYYGTEVQFMKGAYTDIHSSNDIRNSIDLTGRAYFGPQFANAPNHVIYKHIRKLNAMRKAIPALQKGSWRWDGTSAGNAVGFVRKFGSSECAVGLAKDGSATFNFSGLTNGIYRDAVTGNAITVSNGTLSFTVSSSSAGIYVLNGPGMIGALGEGYFQSSSNGGGGTGGGGVSYSPQNPIPGQSLTVTYSGSLANGSQVIMHYSFDNWTVGGINDINMSKQGNSWVATVSVPATAKINFAAAFNNGNGTWDNNNSQDYKTSLGQADNMAPVLVSTLPLNNASNVSNQPQLKLVFSEAIKLGTGMISIYENNNLKASIDLSNHQGKISVNGASLEILGQSFSSGTQVYILVPSGAILDLSNNAFTGILNSQQWRFGISTASSIEELELNAWMIYPNPAGEMVFIRSLNTGTSIKHIQLYDMTGSKVELESYGDETARSLNLQGLAQGIYMIEIESEDGKIIRKELVH
ncbi:MAG: alpha-amylase family glycosyl hydrolase [Bacteroidia bacterium]